MATWTAVGLVILGAWLRLHDLGAMEFKRDEQEALAMGIQLLTDHPWSSDHAWPAVGNMSSNGVPNPPLFTWAVAALWALARDPVGVARLIALVNVVSLFFVWLWARRRMDEGRALLTLAIAAVSPFGVLFSRKIWNPDLLLPGVLALLWGVEWLRSARPWRGAALLLLASLCFGQLHQSGPIGLALLPIAIGLQLARDSAHGSTTRWRRPTAGESVAIAAALAASLFFWLPYVVHLTQLPSLVANRPTLEGFAPALLLRAAAQIVPVDLFAVFDARRDDFLRDGVRYACYTAAVVLGIPLFVYGVWRWLRSPGSVPVFGIWWLCLIAVFTLARIPCHPHYVLALSPLTALLPAGAFDGSWRRRWVRRAVVAWRLAYVVALLALTVTTSAWIAARGGAAGDYGVSYSRRKAQAEAIVAMIESRRTPDADALGEARPADDPGALTCHALPPETIWLVRWLANHQTDVPLQWSICDGWIDKAGRSVYRWAVRP